VRLLACVRQRVGPYASEGALRHHLRNSHAKLHCDDEAIERLVAMSGRPLGGVWRGDDDAAAGKLAASGANASYLGGGSSDGEESPDDSNTEASIGILTSPIAVGAE
jgi:hypothetical protein